MTWATIRCGVFALGVVAIAGPALGQGTVLSDDFTLGSAQQAWQVYGAACLTAGSGSGSIPTCPTGGQGGLNGAVPDAPGSGALRLTQAVGGNGGIVSLNAFPSSAGFSASFSAVAYGGTGSDGLSLFLLDASMGLPATLGQYGGGLGYAGVSGGFLGVGLDEHGNFANFGCGFSGGSVCTGGTGFTPNTVGVRGSTPNSNAFIAATTPGFALWSDVPTRAQAIVHIYTVVMTATGLLSVSIDGVPYVSNLRAYSQTGTLPGYLRLGIAGSIGAGNNIHEILKFSVSSLTLSNLIVSKSSTLISDPVNGTKNPKMIPGAKVRYCVVAYNIPGSSPATSVTVSDPIRDLPLTYVTGSIRVNGTVSGAGTCNWDGTNGGIFANSSISATLADIPAGTARTIYFDVLIN